MSFSIQVKVGQSLAPCMPPVVDLYRDFWSFGFSSSRILEQQGDLFSMEESSSPWVRRDWTETLSELALLPAMVGEHVSLGYNASLSLIGFPGRSDQEPGGRGEGAFDYCACSDVVLPLLSPCYF